MFYFIFSRSSANIALDEAKVFYRVASQCQQKDYLELQTGKYVVLFSTEIKTVK